MPDRLLCIGQGEQEEGVNQRHRIGVRHRRLAVRNEPQHTQTNNRKPKQTIIQQAWLDYHR
jgi:hypothetical protein